EEAVNHGVMRLAATLYRRGIVAEVATGFIKGRPSIGDGMRALRCNQVLVYPLFLSAGYFTRVRLPQLLEDASAAEPHRTFHILSPLGLEPSLPDIVARSLTAQARRCAITPKDACAVLLAHGSRTDPASRMAAEQIARKLQRRGLFRNVRVALLEESPSLSEAASALSPPILVFGLFAGDGLHGAGDAPRLINELGCSDVVFAGTLASVDGIADFVAAAVARMIPSSERALRETGLRSRRAPGPVVAAAAT